ncbi:MAG: cytochrome P450 [Actinomycetota bacterium]|nr:cytochrome P450 [Actinomycetota bacterium]
MTHYDPHAAEIHADPYPIYEALRRECPIYHNERLDCWALFRFEAVQAASRDWETFTTRDGTFLKSEIAAVREFFPAEGKFLDMDPPRSAQLRAIVKRPFSASEVKTQEPSIRQIARELIGSFRERGSADLAKEFAEPLPVTVISDMLGVPRTDQKMVSQWSHDLHLRNRDGTVPAHAMEAGFKMRSYFERMIEVRRPAPSNDLMTDIAHATVEDVPLTINEMLGMAFLLYVAGNETTRLLITTSLLLLAKRPDERERLAAHPSSIPTAIEEILRFDAPVANEARTVTRDVEIGGTVIPQGKQVLLVYGSANRDEAVFEDADTLRLDRPSQRHLAFGEGIHSCLGRHLARLEARVALEEILASLPLYHLAGPTQWPESTVLRGPVTLPVEF